MKDFKKLCVGVNNTVEETIAAIQAGHVGIALVLDDKQRLVSTVTDGDIRRAILNRIPLDSKITALFGYRSKEILEPIVAALDTPHEKLLQMMKKNVIRQIPLLDNENRVVELALLSELLDEELHFPVRVIVMAGGEGKRLYPFTKSIPKPMLPLKNRPLMERIIRQLGMAGIKKVHIATNYKSDVIINHFGNGDGFGVDISYLKEDRPLGTAGALKLLDEPDSPTLVVNGDILTQLDFRAMFDFHTTHKAVMTVGVRKCDFRVPYGVIETDDIHITNIAEKPQQTFLVNAGIYLLEPQTYKYIPCESHFDMTDLVHCLLKEGLRVISFPIQEYWLDVGYPVDYKQAKEDVKNGKV